MYNFVSDIASVASSVALIVCGLPCAPAARVAVPVITESLDHVKIKFT